MNTDARHRLLESTRPRLAARFEKVGAPSPYRWLVGQFVSPKDDAEWSPLEDREPSNHELVTAGGCVVFALGPEHLGVWRKWFWQRPREVVPLGTIAKIELPGFGLRLHLDGGRVLALMAFDRSERDAFASALLTARAAALSEPSQTAVADALAALESGELTDARRKVEQACEEEGYCALPQYLRHLLCMRGGDADGAYQALEAIASSWSPPLALLPSLWLDTAMTSAQRHHLGELIVGDRSVADLDGVQAAFFAFYAVERGDGEACIAGLERLLRLLGPADRELIAFAERVLELCEAPAQSRTALERIQHLLAELKDAAGGAEGQGPSEPQATDALLEQMVGGAAARQAAEILVLGVRDTLDLRARVAAAWAGLRADDPDGAKRALGAEPVELVAAMNAVYRPGDPMPWTMALIAAELMVRSGGSAGAADVDQVLGSAFGRVVQGRSADQVLIAQASGLRDFYRALGHAELDRVRAYLGFFAGTEGLEWTVALAARVLPDLSAVPPALPEAARQALFDEFEQWTATLADLPLMAATPELARQVERFRALRETDLLQVVFAGETSAGKSTFINACLQLPVLGTHREEATAVPTHLRRDATWAVRVLDDTGGLLEHHELDGSLSPERVQEVQDLVMRHSFLGGEVAERAARVVVSGPFPTLPDNVEYVDLPGFNARDTRSQMAEEMIERAHACVFVIDSRSAIKAGEVQKIRWVADAVGKTLFVVNKVDLIASDDDLDVDDDALVDVLARAGAELARSLGAEPPELLAVSSLLALEGREDALPEDAVPVREAQLRLGALLEDARPRLIAHAAAKAATLVTNRVFEQSRGEVEAQERQIARLVREMPEDPATFRQYLMPRVIGHFNALLETYCEAINSAHDDAVKGFANETVRHLASAGDRQQLQIFAEHVLPQIFDLYVQWVDQIRNELWERFGQALLEDTVQFFAVLYSNVEFQEHLDRDRLLRLATHIPLGDITPMLRNSAATAADGLNLSKMVVAGVAGWIGAALMGPIGWGLALLALMNQDDPRFQIRDRVGLQFNQLQPIVEAALMVDLLPSSAEHRVPRNPEFTQWDTLKDDEKQRLRSSLGSELDPSAMAAGMSGHMRLDARRIHQLSRGAADSPDGDLPPLLQAIAENIDSERRRFASLIGQELESLRARRRTQEQLIEHMRVLATDASRWRHRLTAITS